MGKDKLPRIPSFAELGISEDEIEELEREIAGEVDARKQRGADEGAPAGDRRTASGASRADGDDRADRQGRVAAGGAAPSARDAASSRTAQTAAPSRAELKRRARLARKAERQQRKQAKNEARAASRADDLGTPSSAADSDLFPAPPPWRGLRGLLTLLILVFTAWFSSSYRWIPAPVPSSAPDSVFSSERAMAHLLRIASEARPTGSPAHGRVREYLLDELRSLGHEPSVQTATSFTSTPFITRAATVRNVLARIPGTQPGGAAVLITAHYDSREISLGAGDAASGVAAILEALRVLGEREPLHNDLIVLFTDAEELGLLGARAFVDEHLWLDDVALVLSIEMRGGGGPSLMFETGENNGWVIDALRLADPYPAANSVGYEIYRRMPNDTDFTPFKEAGKQGLNFAGVGRAHVYHQVYDSPGNFAEATLQHHGEHAVAMLAHFGNADLTTVNAPNVSYVSIPFLGLVTYGTMWIWVLGVVAVLGWVIAFIVAKRSGARTGGVVGGLLVSLVFLVLAGAMALYLFRWRSGHHVEFGALYAGAFHEEGWYALAIATAAFALATAVTAVFRRWLSPAELALGALIVPVGLAATATVVFPMAATNFQWPAIAGCLGAVAVAGVRGRTPMGFMRWLGVVVAAIPVVVVLTPLTEMVWAAMGLGFAAPLAVLMGLAFVMLVPVLEAVREPNSWWAPLAGLLAGGAFLLVGMSTATPSADRPAPSTLVYALDRETGSAYWGTDPSRDASDPGIAWAAAAVGPFGTVSVPDSLDGFTTGPQRFSLAPTEPVDIAPPTVAIVSDPARDDVLRVAVASSIGAEAMLFRIDSEGMRLTAVNEARVPADGPLSRLEHWGTRAGGVLLDFNRGPDDELLRFTVVEHHLRPGELVGADRFARPPELAPNVRMLSDRAMIRTRVTLDLQTREVRIEEPGGDAAMQDVDVVPADTAGVSPEATPEAAPDGDTTGVVPVVSGDTAARDTIGQGCD